MKCSCTVKQCAILHTTAGPYQAVQGQQELKQLYSLSMLTVSCKMFHTVMKSAVLHIVVGPYQAVW
jgi:hypothetical protein